MCTATFWPWRRTTSSDRIIWFHIRQLYFSCRPGAPLRHPDAVFFASLLSERVAETPDQRAVAFLRGGADARALFWAAKSGAKPRYELTVEAAVGGCAWAEAELGIRLSDVDELQCAVDKGESEGMIGLAELLQSFPGSAKVKELLQTAVVGTRQITG